MKIIRYFCLKLFFLLFLLYFLGGTAALINASQEKQENKRVLVVNSYHPGYTWSDDIMLGIQDVFGTQGNIKLIIEYLDTKRHFEKSYYREIKELFRYKYRTTDIDLIITSDDNALDFVLSIRKELFPDIPLVFCGIDYIKPERIANQEPVYGIEEADSTLSTIELILSIHPDIESIAFIVDETSTGKLMIDKTKKIESTYNKKVHFNYIIGMSVEELKSTLKDIPDNTVIFYLSFIRDKNGKVFSIKDSMRLIAENANNPVYCSWGFQPTTGVLGGNILSGYKQGEISAKVARKLLDSNSVESIPATQQAPLIYKFDYQALDRFNIDKSRIPQNSIIYNKPFSFYEEYKTLILITIFIGFCLVVFIMLLSLNIERRKKAEGKLQKAHDNLDQKVKVRTADLMKSNELLNEEVIERKQAGEELLQSKDKLNRMFQFTDYMVCIADLNKGYFTKISPAFTKHLGWSEQEMLSKPILDFIHPDDVKKTADIIKKQMEKEVDVIQFENRYKTKKGDFRWFEWSANPVPKEGITYSAAYDITERKEADEALRISNERFLTVLDSIDATIYVADMETYEILFMNKYMIDTFGKNMTGEICWKAFRTESGPCPFCTNDQLIDENRNPTDVCVWHDKNPITDKWYINHDRAIKWMDGRLVRLQIATDISDIKRMEEELLQAQKMEAIGTLAGGIAHDFNNILFPLVGYAEMLKEDLPAGHPFQENADTMLSSALRARDLVQQILTFSRKSELEIKPLKLQAVINEAIKLIRPSIPTTIEIHQNIDSDCGAVNGDPTKLHQIVMNLATNAYHAMEEEGGKLTIALDQVYIKQDSTENTGLLPGTYACLTVADNGIGIGKDVIDKIFDPYFTTKEQGKGTGLGLSVVHGIVKECNGDIRIHSEPGKGTDIHVYIPIIERRTLTRLETAGPIIGGTERILLVDDEEAVVRMEQRMLERLGYQMTLRTGSIEALEAFKANPEKFDLVITDLTMPNMTGIQLAREIKNIKADIPIIICTGFSEQLTDEKCRAVGINEHIMKPVIVKELAATIRNVLDTPVES